MKLKVLDLFAGIGGFSLGLERTGGFETVAFCEKDEKAQLVLKKHWPDTPVYGDIKELTHERLQSDGIVPDIITGGFPCQDISAAGKGKGIIGERSGLWSEMFRLIRDVRPAWAIIENVSALRSKGLALVLQDFCSVGYCAEWHCIPASAVGAPHQRDRVWITAYHNTDSEGQPVVSEHGEASKLQEHVANTKRGRCGKNGEQRGVEEIYGSGTHAKLPPKKSSADVAHANKPRLEGRLRQLLQECATKQPAGEGGSFKRKLSDHWESEPNVGRVVDGIPRRVDRLRQLGNAVVPQIPELLGRAILSTNALHGDSL